MGVKYISDKKYVALKHVGFRGNSVKPGEVLEELTDVELALLRGKIEEYTPPKKRAVPKRKATTTITKVATPEGDE